MYKVQRSLLQHTNQKNRSHPLHLAMDDSLPRTKRRERMEFNWGGRQKSGGDTEAGQVQKSYIHTGVNTEIEDGAVSTCNLFLQESCTGLLMEQIRNSQDAPSYQYQMERDPGKRDESLTDIDYMSMWNSVQCSQVGC